MTGKTIAVYSLKGGVGKTTLAVNLAWAAAMLSSRRALLWDLDGQAAATYILGHDAGGKKAQAAIRRDLAPEKLVTPTATERPSLLPADASLHGLDVEFHQLDKKNRLAKIAGDLTRAYDRILIDCPPGLNDTSDQILRAADLVIVPVIPSPLAQRALAAIEDHMGGKKSLRVPILPVFSMVDRRRALHRAALAEAPDWPVIPMASAYERMAEARAPIAAFVPRASAPVAAVAALWQTVEKRLAGKKIMTATTRHAACRCGEIRIACTGEPIRVSVCHCRECKARSGSAFAAQVRFSAKQVRIEGEAQAKMWQYTGDSGNIADFFFCATCGSGVWYRARPYHDAYAIPLGNFERGHGFVPQYSVYEERKEPWVSITGDAIDHYD